MTLPKKIKPNSDGSLRINFGYTPNNVQADIHKNLRRFNVLVLHRRAGKTYLAVHEMFSQALKNKKPRPQYAFIGPNYGQVKRVAWDYMKDLARKLPGHSINEAELRIDVHMPGMDWPVRFYCLGADNPHSLLGIYLDGVVLDEYGSMNPTVWDDVIFPTLTDQQRGNKGWAIFIGTPQGDNHFAKLFHTTQTEGDWYVKRVRASESGIFEKENLDQIKQSYLKRGAWEDYLRNYECDFEAAIKGAYYKNQVFQAQQEGRVVNIPHTESRPVDCYFDLGKSDGTAIWFHQRVGPERRFLDYAEGQGWDIPDIGKVCNGQHVTLEELVANRRRKYLLGTAYLPHDANANRMGMGKSIADQVRDLRVFQRVEVLPRHGVNDGIQQVRSLFSQMWFDPTYCAQGIRALSNYKKSFDEKKQVYSDKPLHDWSSHAADAMRIYAMSDRQAMSPEDLSARYHFITDYDELSY